MEKITKKEMYSAIKEVVAGAESEVSVEQIVAFCDEQIRQLEGKAEKAKARAEKKKAEGDELKEKVKALLTDELQTGDEITAALESEDVTKGKVVYRLSALVAEDIAVKEKTKIDGREVVAYKLA